MDPLTDQVSMIRFLIGGLMNKAKDEQVSQGFYVFYEWIKISPFEIKLMEFEEGEEDENSAKLNLNST